MDRPGAWDFVNGYHAAIIVYGQTGSGKTHTVFGPPPPASPGQQGLAISVAEFILGAVQTRARTMVKCELGVSSVEVFGQDVSDLLSDKPIGVSTSQNRRMGHRFVLSGPNVTLLRISLYQPFSNSVFAPRRCETHHSINGFKNASWLYVNARLNLVTRSPMRWFQSMQVYTAV